MVETVCENKEIYVRRVMARESLKRMNFLLTLVKQAMDLEDGS